MSMKSAKVFVANCTRSSQFDRGPVRQSKFRSLLAHAKMPFPPWPLEGSAKLRSVARPEGNHTRFPRSFREPSSAMSMTSASVGVRQFGALLRLAGRRG